MSGRINGTSREPYGVYIVSGCVECDDNLGHDVLQRQRWGL